ncbi:dehydratase [Roseivivax isoporae LMG 25204]|uniref:Dehydratase n=1 Tax=Roseivivax isoporae LMG 25204 TaxID=1449351 RepID=X7FAB0_9RHOB|nr:dehydratase [Roseivivax isoporae LMG 25204]
MITGGCGFIGRHVARELLAAGDDVVLYDALIDQVHGGSGAESPEGARVIRGDVRDADALDSALPGVDRIVHLAAEVGVGQSMYEIARYVGVNDLGTAVLLEAAARHEIGRIVLASSMSVYGEGLYVAKDGTPVPDARRRPEDAALGRWEPHRDGVALQPVPTDETKPVDLASIYALTKFTQERAVLIFGETYGVDAVALRLFNVFGAGQALSNPYTGVLANFAARIANGQRPTIFEDGEQRRDFVHVEDVARAFRLALQSGDAAGRVFNVGSGEAYGISEVARRLAAAMNRPDITPEILGKVRKGDIRNCFADISRARAQLGFVPRHRLEDSLVPFAAWVASAGAEDRGAQMRAELEARGLMA